MQTLVVAQEVVVVGVLQAGLVGEEAAVVVVRLLT
jgi:hypothetical protein